MARIVGLINGPNLKRLGLRDPQQYGAETLASIENNWQSQASRHGYDGVCFQSNGEGSIIDFIEAHESRVMGWVVNPGALMICGYALADAISDSARPFVEVHLSKVFQREEKRHRSVIAPYCAGQIIGFQSHVYHLGFLALQNLLEQQSALPSP